MSYVYRTCNIFYCKNFQLFILIIFIDITLDLLKFINIILIINQINLQINKNDTENIILPLENPFPQLTNGFLGKDCCKILVKFITHI